MSLVNDALQRAKQQTAKPVGSTNLQLRPAETTPTHNNSGRVLTFAFIGILIAAGAVVPLIARGRVSNSVEVTPKSREAVKQAATETVAKQSTQIPIQASTVRDSIPAAALPNTNAITAPAEKTASVTATPASVPTPIKLNGIVFNATKPSAIVNGKTVFPNSRVGDFTVRSITADSVQLVSATETNVLRFEDL